MSLKKNNKIDEYRKDILRRNCDKKETRKNNDIKLEFSAIKMYLHVSSSSYFWNFPRARKFAASSHPGHLYVNFVPDLWHGTSVKAMFSVIFNDNGWIFPEKPPNCSYILETNTKMRTRSNSIVRLDWYHHLVTRTILDFQVNISNLPPVIRLVNRKNMSFDLFLFTCSFVGSLQRQWK